jgi:putative addiction module component (TIGR02574 family)
MTVPAVQLLPALRALDVRDRAEIASVLIQSLDGGDGETFEDAWDEELEARAEDLLSGKVQGIPAEEVFARLSARFS